MPYKSKQQEKWAHTKVGTKALGGKEKVKEWDSASKGKSLPPRVEKKSAKIDPMQPRDMSDLHDNYDQRLKRR